MLAIQCLPCRYPYYMLHIHKVHIAFITWTRYTAQLVLYPLAVIFEGKHSIHCQHILRANCPCSNNRIQQHYTVGGKSTAIHLFAQQLEHFFLYANIFEIVFEFVVRSTWVACLGFLFAYWLLLLQCSRSSICEFINIESRKFWVVSRRRSISFALHVVHTFYSWPLVWTQIHSIIYGNGIQRSSVFPLIKPLIYKLSWSMSKWKHNLCSSFIW